MCTNNQMPTNYGAPVKQEHLEKVRKLVELVASVEAGDALGAVEALDALMVSAIQLLAGVEETEARDTLEMYYGEAGQ